MSDKKKKNDDSTAETKPVKNTDKKKEKSTPKISFGAKFKGFFKKIGNFFRECKNEIKKVVWPTPKATFKNMGIVLVVIVIVGLFVFGLDTGLINLLGTFMSVAR